MIASVIKRCKNAYLDVFSEFVFECKIIENLILLGNDKVLNTTEITLIKSLDEKITYERYHCLIHTISIVNMCFFSLIAISINCYFYYTKYYLRNKNLLPYLSINEYHYV